MPDGICAHHDFDITVIVNRLEDKLKFMADVTIKCKGCGMPFQFEGLTVGLSLSRPTVSPFGFELRAPIKPYMPIGPVPENVTECFEDIRRDALKGGADG